MRTNTKSIRKDTLLAVLAALSFILAASPDLAAAGGKYKIGDRVECDPSQIGQFKPGTIVDFPKNETERSGRFFYVLLDGSHITEGYLCMATHMRAISGAPPAAAPALPRSDPGTGGAKPRSLPAPPAGRKAPASPVLTIPMSAGIPPIPGTAWKMDFGIKRGNVQRILFCKSGRWEVVSSQLLTGGAVSLMGRYSVSGSTLALTGDGKTTNYRISRNDVGLLLSGGSQDMRLYEPVPTECK
jgi:hypothetical protein